MSEDTTRDLPPFEERIIAAIAEMRAEMRDEFTALRREFDTRMTALEARVVALEVKVDARLRETRPIWENVLTQIKLIGAKLTVFGKDLVEVRAETELLKQRMPPAA